MKDDIDRYSVIEKAKRDLYSTPWWSINRNMQIAFEVIGWGEEAWEARRNNLLDAVPDRPVLTLIKGGVS